jgi:hypothetical protein
MSLFQPRSRVISKVSLFCLVLPLLLSCSSFSSKKNDEKNLLTHIEAFNSAIRWEDYQAASSWVVPQLQEEFWRQADSLQGHIRLMDFQVRNIALENEGFSGTVVLRFRYYYTDDPHLRSKTLQQRWRYLEKEKVWQIVQYDLAALMADRP